MTFQTLIFDTYSVAHDHAIDHIKCAHVSCGALINGELILITTNTPNFHAEIECLKLFRSNVLKYPLDLIVIRSLKSGQLGMAKPCSNCLPVIQEYGVRYVYYSNYEGYITKEPAINMKTNYITSGNLKKIR